MNDISADTTDLTPSVATNDSDEAVDRSRIARRLRRIDPPKEAALNLHETEIAAVSGPLVIVGDPGAGKTVLMEELGRTPDTTFVRATRLVRMANPRTALGNVKRLIIDGVDEVASNAPGGGVEAVLTKLSELGYPDFIMSCRAADWRGAADRVKIKDDYGVDATMLALEPFDRDDAAAFLMAAFPTLDPERLLAHLVGRGLHDIYGNPLTLRLLGEVAIDGGALPNSRGELLAQACPKLVLETNDRHKDRPHAGQEPDDLMLSAGAGATAFLLCDKLGVFSGAQADLPQAYFSLASVRSLPSADLFDEATKTRLFKGEGENLLVPVHRVVAEYLAARWLAHRVTTGQSARRILTLLRQGGSVPTSLRAVNAWLAGFSPELCTQCIIDDPYGVLRYGDTGSLSLPGARALLKALAALSHEDPYFRAEDWSRQSAHGLARIELKDELLALLKSPGEHQLLGGLLIEALQGTELATILAAELRVILLDPERPYRQRTGALDILAEHKETLDWTSLLASLGALGDMTSFRIAANSAMGDAFGHVVPAVALPVMLANIGFTVSPVKGRGGKTTSEILHAGKRFSDQSIANLDAWLDTIADYGNMPGRMDQRRMKLVDFALSVLATRIARTPDPSPQQLARWTGWLRGQRGYDNKAPNKIRDFLAERVVLRREVQAELLLTMSAKELEKQVFRVGDVQLGLFPDPEDCAALLRAWGKLEDAAGADTKKWEIFLWSGRSRAGLTPVLRLAAEETARGDPDRLEMIERYSKPIEEHRNPEDESWEAERNAERNAAFQTRRDWISQNLVHVDAGTAILNQVADAYRGRDYYVNDLPGDVGAKMDAFLTPALATRVLAGFVASLKRTDLPTALEIAKAHASNKQYDIETVLIAGVAEMLRSGAPLSSIPRQNLDSVFMAWRRDADSNTDDPIGIEDGLAALVLATPADQERFYRTSIEPELEANARHVRDLYYLTHLLPMVELASRLTREWLIRFPMVRAMTMAEMMPSVLAADLQDIRNLLLETRAKPCADYDALFMWLSLDFMADFTNREADLRAAAADRPEFLWNLRSIIHHPTGSRLGALTAGQLGFIVSAFAAAWPHCERPNGVTSGEDNPWDASAFILECIGGLAGLPTAAAAEMLETLVVTIDHGYSGDLKHARGQQRRVQADHDYLPAELGALRAAVSDGLPQTLDDLRAFFADRMSTLKAKLAGDAIDSWSVYWDRERPHDENSCRNRLIGQISSELPASIAFGPEEQMPGVTRADIGVRLGKMLLPVEIKGQWHPQVWAAASAQLDAQYTGDWRANGRGVYLVLWFGDVVGFNLPPHPDSDPTPASADALRAALVDRIPPDRRPLIDVYVIDVSGTFEGRERLSLGRKRKRAKSSTEVAIASKPASGGQIPSKRGR